MLHILQSPKKIYLLIQNNLGEKQLHTLTPKDNNFKLELLFKRNLFDIALRFATNLDYDEPLLAEISRLHGDHLYAKGDFINSIANYKLTVKHLEPSYVIKRFLDVSKIEHLISYLEHLHDQKKADKHHTALLLNCYVKQKAIRKLEKFISKSSFDSELFDTETAIKVCKESNYVDLAIKLALQSKYDLLYLKLLIEDKKAFEMALLFIQRKAELMVKFQHLREFG